MAPEPTYPLYTTTYHTHRLSPLYHFSPSSLPRHASTLHNLLRGETLRGVRVDLSSTTSDLSRIGSLQSVTWKNLLPQDAWIAEEERIRKMRDGEIEEQEDTVTSLGEDEGIGNIVEVVYERARYVGILLKEGTEDEVEGDGDEDELSMTGFSSFPLLLTHMPAPLRETFINFLSSTFDTRTSTLKLPPKFMTKSLERYFSDLVSDEEDGNRVLRDIVKDLVITRSFYIPGNGLKSLDITINREDLWPLLLRGRKLLKLQDHQAMNRKEEECNPFMKALSYHIDKCLALDLEHKDIGISKIACGAFVLGGEGKIKIGKPVGEGDERVSGRLLGGLIGFAKGRGR